MLAYGIFADADRLHPIDEAGELVAGFGADLEHAIGGAFGDAVRAPGRRGALATEPTKRGGDVATELVHGRGFAEVVGCAQRGGFEVHRVP